jgi:hypothetical protein
MENVAAQLLLNVQIVPTVAQVLVVTGDAYNIGRMVTRQFCLNYVVANLLSMTSVCTNNLP